MDPELISNILTTLISSPFAYLAFWTIIKWGSPLTHLIKITYHTIKKLLTLLSLGWLKKA
jgi:hypothetical protein